MTFSLGRCRSSIKAGPSPHSLIHSSPLHLLENKPCGPTPLANSCNEPCVRQCQDSTVVIQPSPVVVTLPGPILSSFPQSTAVGSSTSAAVGSILSSAGVPISSGGFGLSGLSSLGSRSCGTRCLPC
ncbi:feather keratin 1-like [Rissa tridactyla]|uniref:feather keratin 1-like n=1 Tax=Rissa tridactyla TaxID=75485 RepID=UPI0023BB19E4|nr:feather keratin 1-like [Rissa tridactyla]XP_054080775.1 feather keratin 1-like [Rissa tridactyla]